MHLEWNMTNVGSLVEITSSKRVFHSDYCTSGVPFYRGKEIIERANGRTVSTELFISEEKFNELKAKNGAPKKNDILLTSVGTLGIPYLVNKADRFYFKDGNLTWFRNFSESLLPEYLYLWFRSSIAKNELDRITIGSTQQALTISSLKTLPISVPPITEQRSIAHILGSLDDKIELNRQMNTTLEAMAQALFKSWFVDFDPVIDNALAVGNPIPDALKDKAAARVALGDARKPLPEDVAGLFPAGFVWTEGMGWIPDGWEHSKLVNLLEVKYGKDHKKLNEGDIPVYGSGGLMRHVDKSLYAGESILIPRKGTLSNLMYVEEEFWSVDTMFFSIPKLPNSAKYLFYFLKTFDFSAMNVGSAVPSMTTKVLNDLDALKPSEKVLQTFEQYIADFFKRKSAIDTSSEVLGKLRDVLLPKLLSGELRIPDAEKLIKDAGV